MGIIPTSATGITRKRCSSPAGPDSSARTSRSSSSTTGWEVYALDDLSTGSLENVEHLRDAPGLPPRRRLRAARRGRQRARAQVRRRLPPGRGGRRAADRRAARAHARHEPRRNRDRARPLQPLRQARARRVDLRGLRRPPRGAPARGGRAPDLRADHGSALGVCRLEGDGRVPRARLPPGARPRLRDRPALQHRRARARAGSTGW